MNRPVAETERPTDLPLKAVVFEHDGDDRLGRLEGSQVIDAGPAGGSGFYPTPAGWELIREAGGARYELSDVLLRAPLRPLKIVAIGSNYRSRVIEADGEFHDEPDVFAKFPSSVVGPNEAIIIPREETRPECGGEVAIVIGRPTYRATRDTSRDAIGAITALIDVSGRRAQGGATRQLTLGKSYDTFTPLGPCLVDARGIDLADLRLTTDISGERTQDSRCTEMISSAVELVEYLSRGMSLQSGDVIATGTPGRIGHVRKQRRYLGEGDVVEVTVTHVGTLRCGVTVEP